MATGKVVTFRSTDENLHIVQVPQTDRVDAGGHRVSVAGIRHEFRGGVLTVDADKTEELKFLREHKDLNTQGGFFEVGNEPDRPKPEVSEVVNAIVSAGLAGNAIEVRNILQGERDSHDRVEVVTVGESTLTALGYGEDHTTEHTTEPSEGAAEPSEGANTTEEPFEGYDDYTAAEVTEWLEEATPEQVADVKGYEAANKNRSSIADFEKS